MKRIGIFGGTFNPIHHGHIHVIAHVIHEQQLDVLNVMVAGDPYHKQAPTVDARLRYDWCVRACGKYFSTDMVVVDDREILREGPTYTIDTLRELHSENPDSQLVLVVGDDIPPTMKTWKQYEEISNLAELYVISRTIFAISSNTIRMLRSQKRPITGLVPVEIEAEILARSLYNIDR